jgi:peroxin-6
MIKVDVPNDSSSRVKILKALTRKFDLHEDVDFEEIERNIPDAMSGADLYSLVASAMNHSIGRAVKQIEDNNVKEEDAVIRLTRMDFEEAIREFATGTGG